jgi:hypothetical protein
MRQGTGTVGKLDLRHLRRRYRPAAARHPLAPDVSTHVNVFTEPCEQGEEMRSTS